MRRCEFENIKKISVNKKRTFKSKVRFLGCD